MFAQQCERIFEVGLSGTMSVSSKYYFQHMQINQHKNAKFAEFYSMYTMSKIFCPSFKPRGAGWVWWDTCCPRIAQVLPSYRPVLPPLSSSPTRTKKRDYNAAVPLPKALVLPSNPNKQHESPRYYVYMHAQSAYVNTHHEHLVSQCFGLY